MWEGVVGMKPRATFELITMFPDATDVGMRPTQFNALVAVCVFATSAAKKVTAWERTANAEIGESLTTIVMTMAR